MFQGCLKLLEERERGDLFQGCLKLLEGCLKLLGRERGDLFQGCLKLLEGEREEI